MTLQFRSIARRYVVSNKALAACCDTGNYLLAVSLILGNSS